jgi:hypothetical protein
LAAAPVVEDAADPAAPAAAELPAAEDAAEAEDADEAVVEVVIR